FRTGSIGSARFAPDGSIVYDASWEGGQRRVYLARTDDNGSRELGLKDAELLSISKTGELAIRLNTVFRAAMRGWGHSPEFPKTAEPPVKSWTMCRTRTGQQTARAWR